MTNGTALKAATREAMLAGITTVVRTARDIAADTPGADSKFQPPAQRSDMTVLASARQFLDHLPEVKDAFVQHGLPDTFIDDLRRTTDGFAQAISGRAAGKTGRLDARADLVNVFLYSPHSDGQRFLMTALAEEGVPTINVITHWNPEARK